MAKRGRAGRRPDLREVKWTQRVDPADLQTFQAVRARMGETARRRVSDAEVFRLAVAALVASLPSAVRKQLAEARG
jgi:hypothetical protein